MSQTPAAAHDEVDRILATGCPPGHLVAALRELADRFEELRVTKGNSSLVLVWTVRQGRPLEPEAVTQTRRRLTQEPS